jgi:hypothetical protein
MLDAEAVVDAMVSAGIETTVTPGVRTEVWKKLATVTPFAI